MKDCKHLDFNSVGYCVECGKNISTLTHKHTGTMKEKVILKARQHGFEGGMMAQIEKYRKENPPRDFKKYPLTLEDVENYIAEIQKQKAKQWIP